jgi:hypothetical protein
MKDLTMKHKRELKKGKSYKYATVQKKNNMQIQKRCLFLKSAKFREINPGIHRVPSGHNLTSSSCGKNASDGTQCILGFLSQNLSNFPRICTKKD